MGWVPLSHTSSSGSVRLKMPKMVHGQTVRHGLGYIRPHFFMWACQYIPGNAGNACYCLASVGSLLAIFVFSINALHDIYIP